MRNITRWGATTLLAAGMAVGCGEGFGPITELPRELSIAEVKLVEADNRFAFNLFRELSQIEGEENVFISPLSVAMALGMTYNGAAGSTQEVMQEALQLQGMTLEEVNQSYQSLIDLLRNLDPKVDFLLANSIWYRNTFTFEQEFIDLNREFFDAEVTPLDFSSPSAPQTINGWVSDQTRGKITQIVPASIPSTTIMYLINAIYFKGDWTSQFDKSLTKKAPFDLVDGAQTQADMMSHAEPVAVRFHSAGDVRIVDLYYGGQAYSMTIVLPAAPQDIEELANELTQTQWNGWIAGLDSTALIVTMPKFRFELTYDDAMKAVLSSLGMGIAFTDDADFTKLYNGPDGRAFISSVTHKTFVDVNEEGTEAAAATSVEIGLTSVGPQPFVIDRPFLFAIRENYSGTILFLGKVLNPAAS